MKRLQLIAIIFALMLSFSCSKEEGEGGTSTITGKVWVRDYNSTFTFLKSEFYGPEIDVYIMYGTDEIYSDKFSTNYDGSYRFTYLRKGKYTIYAYSKDSTLKEPSGVKPIKVEVEITAGHQKVEAEDIIVLD